MALCFFKKPTPLSKINENDMMILMTPSFSHGKLNSCLALILYVITRNFAVIKAKLILMVEL